jgi:hypothetical protein
MKLPQSQFAFDPQVAKLPDLASPTILLLRCGAGGRP